MSALNNFRTHLRDASRKLALESAGGAIATGARLLRTYLDAIYPDLLQPSSGVVLLQIDFTNGRAYVKSAADLSGSPMELEWTAQEVRQIALLVDALLRGSEISAKLAVAFKSGTLPLAKSWEEFSELAQDPYVPPTSLKAYLSNLIEISQHQQYKIEDLKAKDAARYEQIKTFIANSDRLATATKNQKWSLKLGPANQVYTEAWSRTPTVEQASGEVLYEGLLAAVKNKRLSSAEADRLVKDKFAAVAWLSDRGQLVLPLEKK